MRRYAVSLLLLCFLAVPVAAQEVLPVPSAVTEAFDWQTVAGVVGIAWVLTELLVSFIPFFGMDEKRKKMTALVVALIIGIIAKATGAGFIELEWMALIFNLLLSVMGLKLFHTAVGGPVLDAAKKKKPTP